MPSALVVIDMQEAMLRLSCLQHDREGVVARIAGLLARALGAFAQCVPAAEVQF